MTVVLPEEDDEELGQTAAANKEKKANQTLGQGAAWGFSPQLPLHSASPSEHVDLTTMVRWTVAWSGSENNPLGETEKVIV